MPARDPDRPTYVSSSASPEESARSDRRAVPAVGIWAGPPDEPARYELLDAVRTGGEGTLHRARYMGRGTPSAGRYAVKQYARPRAASATWPRDGLLLQLNDQMVRLREKGGSRHLVDIVDVFDGAVTRDGAAEPATAFVVMPWIEGVALDVDDRVGTASLADRVRWVEHLAAALDVLHGTGDDRVLVHGDVTPANCVLTADGDLVLVDLGAMVDAGGTADRRALRSPAWAAPEVLADPGRRRRPESDRYALGAIAFFLLTGSPPPRSDSPHAALEVLRALEGTEHVPRGRRAAVARHVRLLLDPDPASRGPERATEWAHELHRRCGLRNRRRLLLGAAGVAALTALTVVGVEAVSAPGTAVYEQSFTERSPDWPDLLAPDYSTRFVDPGYRFHVTARGLAETVPAPDVGPAPDQTVSATATLLSGQGVWGVWCRGVDPLGSERYEFVISHAGAAAIIEPDGSGTGWHPVPGLDPSQTRTLTARCTEVPGAPVELTLALDGDVVLVHRPAIVLGPGHSGIQCSTFAELPGPTVTADFHRFEIRRL